MLDTIPPLTVPHARTFSHIHLSHSLVTPMFNDSHPRVRYAACQCVGQLCTDLEDALQEKHHAQLIPVLVGALEDPEPRYVVRLVPWWSSV